MPSSLPSPALALGSWCALGLMLAACNGIFGVSELTYDGGSAQGGTAGASSTGMGGSSTSNGGGGSSSSSTGGGMGGGGGEMMFLEIADALDGLRLEVPCGGFDSNGNCAAPNMVMEQAVLTGLPEQQFVIELRVRGVVEEKSYAGGMTQGFLNVGGQPEDDDWNAIGLTVDDASNTYFLNAGTSFLDHCVALDYTFSIVAAGNSMIRLGVESSNTVQIPNQDSNGSPIVVPDIPPAPQAYNGQFVQLNVVSVTLR